MAAGVSRHRYAGVLVGCLVGLSACTGQDGTAPTSSSTPSMSIPPPAPETTAPSADSAYAAAIATFCTAAGEVRGTLLAMADGHGGGHPAEELAGIADEFHDDFAALYAAHQEQFGGDVNGIEPIDSAFAVDASIALLADQATDAGEITLAADDPIFQQFTEVSNGCAGQGATMP